MAIACGQVVGCPGDCRGECPMLDMVEDVNVM